MVEVIIAVWIVGIPVSSFAGSYFGNYHNDFWADIFWPILLVLYFLWGASWLLIDVPKKLARKLRGWSNGA